MRQNGLLNQLADVGSGVQFENAIYNQLKFLGSLQYYSLKTGKEIDFILNQSTTLEVKETAALRDMQQLSLLSKKIGIENKYIICRYPSPTFDDEIWGGSIG